MSLWRMARTTACQERAIWRRRRLRAGLMVDWVPRRQIVLDSAALSPSKTSNLTEMRVCGAVELVRRLRLDTKSFGTGSTLISGTSSTAVSLALLTWPRSSPEPQLLALLSPRILRNPRTTRAVRADSNFLFGLPSLRTSMPRSAPLLGSSDLSYVGRLHAIEPSAAAWSIGLLHASSQLRSHRCQLTTCAKSIQLTALTFDTYFRRRTISLFWQLEYV